MKLTMRLCLLLLCSSMFFSQAQLVNAETLGEQRERVISSLMEVINGEVTREEAELYLAEEEANILSTGEKKGYQFYGIDGKHSTAHSMTVSDYLNRYFEENTTEAEREKIYPFAVEFDKLPKNMRFYHVDNTEREFADFDVTIEGNKISMYYCYWGPNRSRQNATYIEGYAEVNETKELAVKESNGQDERLVHINSRIITEPLRDWQYIIYFFYNNQGGISLLKWDNHNQPEVFEEYATLETREELEALAAKERGASTIVPGDLTESNWSVPEDWRMLSSRRGDIPPVTWELLSTQLDELVIEPVFPQDGLVTGYVNPLYNIVVTMTQTMNDEVLSVIEATPNDEGYFSIDADAAVGRVPTITILNEQGQQVYEAELPIVQYQPTALEYESGYLTLERYFLGQSYIEGYTYPFAEVNIMQLDGYASTGIPPITADSNGYFYADVKAHPNNLTTNVVTVSHPETLEPITVSPYPWTQAELDNANW
ncbi:MAG: hypothetical protein ACTHZG_06865 [Ruoffia tabacinasalis]